jgi:tRNA A-37 threonylcarbamoyl transferase component Bud32
MPSSSVCPQCGKALASDAPHGLCPECLLQVAIGAESAAAVTEGPASAPGPGLRVKYFGDYELLDEVARGGMGVVWKARQASLNREVALKMIRAGALASPEEVQRFLREAEAAANLQHPNIVAIHEVGEHDGQHYFSMDFVPGRDLGAIVKDGPLPPQRAARYVKIIAEAIHFAHQRGTLHRDLKPQNVLIDDADQPRITDFGLAKLTKDDSRLTQSGAVMGSPSYMPPEQAAGRHADVGPASDVYSLGAILYELLTGRPPFRAATPLATLQAVVDTEPEAPRRIKADVPIDLETLCLKCLEKSPVARYPTARALAEELDRFLSGEPIQARPAGAVRKTLSWCRRHPRLLAALVVLLIVTLALGLLYLREENAFLRAQQAEPTLERVPGWRHQALEFVNGFVWPATSLALLWHLLLLPLLARGVSFGNIMKTPMKQLRASYYELPLQPKQPFTDRLRFFTLCAGVIGTVGSIGLLVFAIQAHVWERESILGQIGGIYLLTYTGYLMLAEVIRDYRLVHFGISVPSVVERERRLTPEQMDTIRRAIEDEHDLVAAVRHFRNAVPDASNAEVAYYVSRLNVMLRAKHPEKFAPPPFSLTTLNWKVMGYCAFAVSVVLGVWWLVKPPVQPASFFPRFAYSLLFGMGLMAFVRVKGLWKRILLLVPGLVALLVSETLVSNLAGVSSWSIVPYLSGLFFGALLMASGFNPRVVRRDKARD